eukprot:Gregarina_sp_Poly_1__2323@NODE_1620_length_3700_cov_81_161299_g1067_i0_p3_GENE_NODE_1620_length_3700_cov_81_161299_g1067_i0NODE_1620_length_3700_cov_81_161299_g1067_i0_p3_ORF_typecomplete_len285_score38_15_NODE_1620_length_3700_cov_81_161299_g1067_i028443638
MSDRVVVNRKEFGIVELVCVWSDKCVRLDREKQEALDRVFDKLSSKINKILNDAIPKRKKVDVLSEAASNASDNLVKVAFLDANHQVLCSSKDAAELLKTLTLESVIEVASYLQIDEFALKVIRYPHCPTKIDIPQQCFVGLPIYVSVFPFLMLQNVVVDWFVCQIDKLPKVKKKKPAKKASLAWQHSPPETSNPFEDYQTMLSQRADVFDIQLADPADFAAYRGQGTCFTFSVSDVGQVCIARVENGPSCLALLLGRQCCCHM